MNKVAEIFQKRGAYGKFRALLEEEGLSSFSASFDELIDKLHEKATGLRS